ncbi:hypothetical protein C8A01DRAFT_39812 [Parachaetomium inaequale]|uniref:Short-chain dehydrogenase n=1 Tax=Parachaetomium inaequale TaxID=2588326 RepID=A0AAN6PC93_9PEZI|nr:hypothetical protein C8A01DRAFT_39812 [Parachaetomium inaequale]
MASEKPVVLVFGAGANIGAALVRKFSGAAYRVAAVSRNAADPPVPSPDGGTLAVRADLSHPAQVSHAFDAVRQTWGAFPSVVIWNVANVTASPDQNNIFSVPLPSFDKDLALMVTSPFAAAGKCFEVWGAAGEESTAAPKRFIMTGNIQPKVIVPLPDFTTIGVAKAGAAYWVGAADLFYKKRGWRFFFAEERSAEGTPMGFTPGAESHAEMFLSLSEGSEDLPSYITFVNGKYHAFE